MSAYEMNDAAGSHCSDFDLFAISTLSVTYFKSYEIAHVGR